MRKGWTFDPAELVPETQPRVGPGSSPRATVLVPKANHARLTFFSTTTQDVRLSNADWVRVVTDAFPVEVYADGELVEYPINFEITDSVVRAPSIDFILRKRVEVLTVTVPSSTLLDTTAERRRVQGIVDLYWGRGDVEILGSGAPVSGSAHQSIAAGGVASITGPMPTSIGLFGLDQSPEFILGRLAITSVSLKVTWAAAAGVIQEVALIWTGSAVSHDLWREYRNDTPPVTYELNSPAHLPGSWAPPNAGPQLVVVASANMTTVDAIYNWEGVA